MKIRINKIYLLLPLFFFVILYSGCSSAAKSSNENPKENKGKYPVVDTTRPLSEVEKEIVIGVNKFGFDLLKQIASVSESSSSNIIFSPFSISMALGLTLTGAKGKTYTQMAKVLGFPGLATEEIEENFNSLFLILENLDKDVEFDIANSAWVDKGFPVYNDYIENLKNYFYAEVFTGCPFLSNPSLVMNEINQWVSEKTNDKIPDLIKDPSMIQSIELFLANAIYFLGKWSVPFDPQETTAETFINYDGSQSTVEMMHGGASFPYAEGKDFQAVSLPYGNGKFFMTIILPKEGMDIYRFVTQEVESAFSQAVSVTTSHPVGACSYVDLYLPKFEERVRYDNLGGYLASMGMRDAFRSNANFSGISPKPLRISFVVHETYVKVDEEGTEAAAATGVGVMPISVMVSEMKVNRPFIFIIHDIKTKSILFMGVILKL